MHHSFSPPTLAQSSSIKKCSKRLVEDPCNPLVDIRVDTLDTQEEKQVLLELSYHSVLTNSFVKPLKSVDHFYTVIIALVALTIQRFYEKIQIPEQRIGC